MNPTLGHTVPFCLVRVWRYHRNRVGNHFPVLLGRFVQSSERAERQHTHAKGRKIQCYLQSLSCSWLCLWAGILPACITLRLTIASSVIFRAIAMNVFSAA